MMQRSVTRLDGAHPSPLRHTLGASVLPGVLVSCLLGAAWLVLPGCGQGPTISGLPDIGLSQGQVYRFDLDDFITDPDNTNPELTVVVTGADATKVNAAVDASTHVLTLTASTSFVGTVTLDVTATDPDGNETSAPLGVQVLANRSCSTVFSYDAKTFGPVTSISVAGQFNTWSTTANPMTDPDKDGIYTSSPVVLAPGYYQYKLVQNGVTWIQDPGNPSRAWLDGVENSQLRVQDCHQPLLTLLDLQVDGATGTVSADVQLTDGADGSGIDGNSLKVMAGDVEVPSGFNAYDRVFEVRLTGLAPGKHSLRVDASAVNGLAAQQLYAPVWVDAAPWTWNDASLYFAFTDRFSDGNTSLNSPIANVATQANYQGGDYAGITARINDGYFTQAGINTLWISPNFDNTNNAEYGDDGRLYSGYHGYWPIAAATSESRMGSNTDLQALISAAHAKGIRVMFDLVSNHVHNQHPYYTQYKNAGWFNAYSLCSQNDGWNTNPVGCWFASYLPDLNYKNADTLNTLVDDALKNLKAYDIDGYRVDAVKHMETAFVRNLVGRIEAEVEHNSVDATRQFYTVGETFTGEWTSGCNNTASCSQWLIDQYVGPGLLDGQFDFPLYWQVLKTFARGESTMSALASVLDQTETYYGSGVLMSTFLGNHDVARFISHANGNIGDQWGNGAKEQGWTNPPAAPTSMVPYQKLEAAFAFLATIRGVPLTYYGDELGLPGAGDPDNRRMMKFGTSLSTFEKDTLTYIQKVFQVRKQSEALRRGDRVTLLGSDPAVIVYGRKSPNDKALVAVNASGAAKTVSVTVSSMAYPTGTTLTDALAGGTLSVSGSSVSLTVPAYGAVIYR